MQFPERFTPWFAKALALVREKEDKVIMLLEGN
jgi:hypothetical protein